jgi:sensor histidine kinase YesM
MKTFLKFIGISLLPWIVCFTAIFCEGNSEELVKWRAFSFSVFLFSILSFAYVYFFEIFLKTKKKLFVKLVLTCAFVFIMVFALGLLFQYYTDSIDLLIPFFQGTLGICMFLLEYLILNFFLNLDKRKELLFTDNNFFYLKVLLVIIFFETVLLSIMSLDFLIQSPSLSYLFRHFSSTVLLLSIINLTAFFSLNLLSKVIFLRYKIIAVILGSVVLSFFIIGLINIIRFKYLSYAIFVHLILCIFSTLLIYTIIDFRDKLNISKKNNKLLSKDILKKHTEYIQLKQQVNPHFLFNNLNVLISLIEINPKKAVEFGHNLSNVYRHYLKNQDEDFVSLKLELEFIKEYLEIYKTKFLNGFTFEIQTMTTDYYVLSLAIQELIENIFKHNSITDLKPIKIKIYIENEFFVVKNTKNQKTESTTTKIGLENIKRRYEILSQKSIHVVDENNFFLVYLPIIKLEEK